MLKAIERLIYSYLSRLDIQSKNKLFLLLYTVTTFIYGALIHIFLLVFYIVTEVNIFININVISVLIYFISCILSLKQKYTLAIFLCMAEVITYVILSTYFLGSGYYSYMYLVLILVLQFSVPYIKLKIRTLSVIIIWISSIVTIIIAVNVRAIIVLESTYEKILAAVNVQVGIAGISALLIARNAINSFIIKYGEELMLKYQKDAYTDDLTKLQNNRALSLFAEQYFADENWYLAILDIDDFKSVNDKYGHIAGNKVLQAISKCMTLNVRKTDRLFRFGGEEFIIALKNISKENALHSLEKIRKEIENIEVIDGDNIVKFTVTIGAAPLEEDSFIDCLRRSDTLLYEGKSNGKNKVVIV